MALDLKALKEQLITNGQDKTKVSKAIAYLSTADQASKHSQQELYGLIVKYLNAGTNLDGTNVILSGKNMGLITFHGYMNKVKALHPDVFFDVQLVREGDTFKFSKNSGKVEYSHDIANPFEDKKIVGAYCVVKLNNGSGDESLELLNDRDYNEMKSNSRNQRTWNQWPSEFWRKSVIKRACKVYFAEEVKDLDEIDNADYGLEDEKASEETKNAILASHAKNEKK
jgi:recombinational DNA repair protein RecT